MAEKYITYKLNGETFNVPESHSAAVERDYPDITIEMRRGDEVFDIPLSYKEDVMNQYGSELTYLHDSDNSETEDDKPSGFESFVKGAGAGLARTAQYAVDLGNLAFKNSVIGKPIDWIRRATDENHGDVDTELRDENNLVTKLTTKLGETADRWSLEADPTRGEQGYADLLKEGKYGMAAQKAMAQGLESAPFMVAAATGLGGALYAGGMAATTYADETRENPDIPSWKRAANAIGSAGLELAVEKIGGPMKNLFGGAGKMTTEAAKELIERASKEGASEIAERIARALGRVGKKTIKEGVEEGGEEVLTSLGNDTLGQVLDWIDRDNDYGFTAQWERIKEENPDATIKDFAKMKGEEYMESFLGGALSGAEISSISSSAKEISDARAHNTMKKFEEHGASLNYNNMYDLYSDVSEAVDNAAGAFVDKDGEPTVDRSFIENLSAEEAFTLSRNEELSASQRTQMGALANIKAMREGMETSLSERLEKAIATDRAIIEEATENGNVITAVYNNAPVFVKGGSIKNGTVTLPNGPVIIIDKSTGVASTVNSNEISAPQVKDANSYAWEIEGKWRQADMSIRERAINTMSPRAKMKAVSQYTGKKMMADFGNGIIEVGVQEILPEKGVVVLKGKKGDLGGQSIIEMGADVFYDSLTRDDAGNPMFAEGEIETEVEPEDTTVETPHEAEVTEEDDFRDTVAPILINGVPVEVEVVSQDNATNRIVYRYTDENGQERTGTASIGEFKTALQQAQEYKPEEPIVPEVPTEPTVEATTEPTPAPTDVPTEIEPVAEEINWDALFEQDQEAFFAELQKQFGEETLDILNEFVSAAQEELDSLNKKKRSSNPNDILATRKQKAALQKRIDAYNQMIARLAPAPETPVVEEPTSETPVETTPIEPTVEPAPTEPVPAEPITTENGFVIVDKVITNPEVIEMPSTPKGDANRIFIGEYNGKWTYGAEALMDNGSWGMTPKMRIENARYNTREDAIEAAIDFLESQWKDRYKDAGSTALDAFVQYVKENYLPKASETEGNSVSLENEPNGEDNGKQREEQLGTTLRQHSDSSVLGAVNEGGQDPNKGNEEGSESKSENSEDYLEQTYPSRKGNATQQLLIDTFGFNSVTIPNTRKDTLNSIYDFMMEMSKMLGISPKSIGHGGELKVANLNARNRAAARHYLEYDTKTGDVTKSELQYKYDVLKGIAHEWFHSLDYVLSYFNTGKYLNKYGSKIGPTSEIADLDFTGRTETLEAIRDVVKAIEQSGHKDRIISYNPTNLKYWISPKEMAARAFEEYMKIKFEEAGIEINGSKFSSFEGQPTAEEMKVIAPAFDKLFSVLQEKEGNTPGTSILYHIGQMTEQGNEVKTQLGALVADWIQQGGNFVVMDNEAMLNALEESGNARMLETPDGVIYGFVKDGVVYLNPSLLNANTSIHEYTHLWDNALMQLNRPLWEKGKALMKKTALWKEVVNDPNYADIKDNEDLVASEVHSRLVGTEGAKRLEQLEQEAREKGLTKGAKDLSILGRLREWLNEAAQWLKDTFSVWSKEEIDAVSLDDFLNMPLRDLANFTALPQAESGQITNENGDLVANNNGNGHIQFSISTWREGGRDYLANWLANDKTLAEDEKADILARMDEFYENAQKYTDVYVPFGTWSEAAVKYDKDGNPLMSVIKANGDYSMNLDFSLVCKKRRPLNMLLRELINRNAFASYTLRERELAEINWILQEHGFEVACALCFVDAKRFRVTGVADVFASLYNRFVKALAPDGAQIAHFNYSNNPNVEAVENGIDTMSDEQLNWKKFDALAKKYGPKTVEGKVAKFLRENPSQRRLVDATDFIDANGFEAVKEGNPTLLSLYNSKKGTGGPKASFGDVQYLNDILKKEKSFDVEKAYAVGGVRLQSFSDFVPHMYFDYMQLFAELAAKKLPAHAYTKEVLFAKIFGMTGIKINMSLVPSVIEGGVAPGLDANGNYAWADAIKDKDGNVIQQAQSFPFDEAMAIQNAEGYSKNCGVIAVGISDAHILKMLNDPNIPFIIPYHKSSLNAIVARMTNIDQYKDYTNVQNTRKADGTKLAKGTPDFNFNAYLRENPEATPQQAAQAYLDWCKEHNYRPKFSQFASHPNYYKLLQDFNTIDAVTGEYTPQGAVTMTFPTEQNEFGNVESLIQQGLQEDAELEEKMSSEISSIADKVIDRLKEIENEPKLSEKKYAEQMAKLADERMARIKERVEDDGILSRSGDVTPENKDIRYRRSDIQNAAVDYLVGEPRSRVIENAVNEEAAKLGVTVTYKTRSEMPNGHKNDKGYYNTKTGEIVVCTENNTSINDAIQTILHEAVAHKGLRQLMGDRFDEFINRVYDALDAETKAKVDELATKNYNGNKAVAMEEYMATLAESENFAETSAWDKIKSIFEKIINSILGRNDIKIGDNELRYILRASYANMVNPRNMETIEGWAKDTTMREEYKINEATPEILSRTDIDPTVVSTEAARAVYDRTVASVSQEFQRQFQDAYQPVRIAIDAIQQETGNQPIEDYENYLLIQNQSSSRSRVEIDYFSRLYYSPIIDQVNMLIDAILESRGFNKNNKAERSRAYKEIRQYLIAKHGLERNAYYQTRNTRLVKAKTKAERIKSVREDHKDIVDQINNDPTLSPAEKRDLIKQEKKRRDVLIKQIRETDYELDVRDYSGLTALFGLRPEQFEEAEDLAKELVENFESNTGDMTEELWKRINKATNKTLKHSYECGLLSRQQYNEIKSMFEFYIPLRGFDEATAEDVYSYARFEGNKFNPAVAKTGGRTSLADDPLALIMNMAESEITQGNKNRAKQALYNFLLNRADGMDTQNSLMQIESVWYIKTIDSFGNELYVIASPDHEAGETLEDFEERMKMLEEAGLAKRSKKGNVDVGMRFQKEKNKGSHYIYLKVNGVEKAIYINGDPKAADAVNGVYSEQYGEGMQKIRDIQRAVSSTFTNYSLEFTARNYFRDMVYSHINIGVRESDPAYRKKFRQNWRHNNIKTMLKMLKAYRAGELDNRALTEDEAAFVEFMRNGGQTGYTLINSVENHKKDLERAIRRMQKGIEKGGIKDSTVFKATLGGIELLNEASELVTRFAAFKTSRDMGRDINTSISDAKEVTVNFNTKGAQDGKGFFGIVARYLGAFKYFFNASIQGVQNLWAMMLSNKIKFGTVVGSTIAFGAMMPLIQGALAALLGDDDDENEYWNIPEYERQNNLCFVLGGGGYAKLPLPIGFREMYGLGDMMAAGIANRKVTRDPLAVATDVSNKIASIVLPINPLEGAANGLSLVESGTNMLLPDLTQGLIQNRTNVDFKGDPIQKEYTYNENDPQWTKAFSNNPAWIKGLCKWMNENIVIDGVGLDVSPEKLDNTFSNLLGGVYSLVKKSGRAISMIWNEDNRHISNVPLIGVMVGTGIDEDDRFVNSSYWDMNDYYKSRLPYIKRTAENFGYSLDEVFKRVEEGETRAGAHHPKMSKIYNRDNFDWMQEWYLGHKGEGETDENGEPILGIDQYKNKIKYLEKKIKKNENGEPTPEQAEKLAKLNADYNKALEGFVYDMLEFD